MASNRSHTIIGAFLLGALVLLTIAILAFGGTRLFSNPRRAIIFFDQSVLGLTNGSRVMFRGVQIGTVKHVQLRLDPNIGKARIAVTIQITDNDVVMLNGEPTSSRLTVPELVKRGLRAQLVVYSYVTSQLAVNLNFMPGSKANFVVDPDKLELPEIPAVPSEMERLKHRVASLPWKQTLDTVNQTMQTMMQLANDMDKTINGLAPNLAKTSDTARQALETVQQAVQANNKQLSATLKSVHELTRNANRQLASRARQLGVLLDNAEQTSKHMNRLTKNLESLTAPDSGTRQDMQSAIRDLAASAAALRHFSETIERDPHALLFGGASR